MFDRTRRLIVTVALIAAGLSTSVLAELRDAIFVMECCTKAKFECAGVGTPDDCCRRMHHTSAPASPSIVSPAVGVYDAAIVMPAVQPVSWCALAGATLPSLSEFKRPHDPPHLHPFSLLV
jgi:hypothetical protein